MCLCSVALCIIDVYRRIFANCKWFGQLYILKLYCLPRTLYIYIYVYKSYLQMRYTSTCVIASSFVKPIFSSTEVQQQQPCSIRMLWISQPSSKTLIRGQPTCDQWQFTQHGEGSPGLGWWGQFVWQKKTVFRVNKNSMAKFWQSMRKKSSNLAGP